MSLLSYPAPSPCRRILNSRVHAALTGRPGSRAISGPLLPSPFHGQGCHTSAALMAPPLCLEGRHGAACGGAPVNHSLLGTGSALWCLPSGALGIYRYGSVAACRSGGRAALPAPRRPWGLCRNRGMPKTQSVLRMLAASAMRLTPASLDSAAIGVGEQISGGFVDR